MDSSKDIFQSRLFRYNRVFLSIVGQWPFQPKIQRRIFFFTLSFVALTQAIAQVIALVILRGDINATFECLSPLLINATCIVKIINLLLNKEKIKMLFIHMQRDWESWAIENEFEILHKFAENGRSITIGYAIGLYGFGCFFSIMALIPKIVGKNIISKYSTRPLGFPYHVEYFIDLNDYYYPVLIHIYVAIVIRLTVVIASDTCVTILVQHCCALFLIVRYRLEHMLETIKQDKKLATLQGNLQDKIYMNFVYCIQKHEDALQFAGLLETINANTFFVEIGLIIMNMSISTLQAANKDLTPQLIIRYGSYLIAQGLHLFILCWLGQQIIDHSSRVYTSIYQSEWYISSPKCRKLLSVMMLRSTSPCMMTIGKIMILSIATFSAVRLINLIIVVNRVLKMDSPNDIFQSRLYRFNRVLLSLLGQWPFQQKRHRRIIFVTISFLGITQAITQVLALITLHGDLNGTLECIPPLIVDSACIVKMINLLWNMEKIKILLIHMQRDWQSWIITSEFEILHKFAETGRSITIGYASGIYAFGSLFSIMAAIPKIIGKNVTSKYSTRPVGFPYHVEYFVDLNKYYYPILIHNYLATAIRLTVIISSDTCVVILVQHCCALFSVVRYRLEHIRKSIEQDKKLAMLEEDDKIYKNFAYCIRKHQDALQFANILETVYSKAFFIEVGLIIGAMSLSALQATTESFTPQLAIRHGGYISAQLLHLYIACWLGQQIIDHSSRVYTSIYRGEWYESSPKSRKLLNMIMLRSMSPCTLTVGKLMVLSLPSFSAVVRASASYFTVFRSVQ
ncbi:uncharacterized protein [Anoplolepis gracilipes]|uniref:uncharacterized protein n=1 Tax=Anoplolepis gracilipes TaxID=354296 RepID=UPI003B9F20F5